jgi:hypothetical protein
MSPFDRHPSGLLADFAEGVLPGPEADQVSQHVVACEDCRVEIESWRVLYHDLARLPRAAVPADLRLRILQAVAREAAPILVPERVGKRRWMAAFSWAYGVGTALLACFALGLALVPAVREGAGSALAGLSTLGLRAGLSVVDLFSLLLHWTSASLQFFHDWFNWLSPLGRALETLGGVAEVRIAGLIVVALSALLLSGIFVRFLHQRNAPEEVTHVGPLLA